MSDDLIQHHVNSYESFINSLMKVNENASCQEKRNIVVVSGLGIM